MIFYNARAYLGFGILFRLYGSVIPRVLPYALVSAILGVILHIHKAADIKLWFDHPYAHHIFGMVLGFILVFRSNLAYQRFWEGRTMLQQMSAKWGDATVQLVSFDEGFEPKEEQSHMDTFERFATRVIHLHSLLHALALQAARNDPPALATSVLVEEDDFTIELQETFRLRRQPTDQSRRQRLSRTDSMSKTQRIRRTVTKAYLLSGLSKEAFRHPLGVIGGISEEEKAALKTAGDVSAQCYLVMHWILRLVVERQREGGLQVPGPILSRTYQVLSDGMLAASHCRKIGDTPFPFPYAQMVILLLSIFLFTSTIAIVAHVDSAALACLLSFVANCGYWSLNEVARELERPFSYDPNGLNLMYHQYAFNEKISLLLNVERLPSTNFDVLVRRTSNAPTPSGSITNDQHPIKDQSDMLRKSSLKKMSFSSIKDAPEELQDAVEYATKELALANKQQPLKAEGHRSSPLGSSLDAMGQSDLAPRPRSHSATAGGGVSPRLSDESRGSDFSYSLKQSNKGEPHVVFSN